MSPDEFLRLAAFGAPARAPGAFDQWSRARGPDALDPRELRLLAPVYENLRRAGIADVEIAPVVKQVAQSTLIATHLVLRDATAAVELLAADGFDALLLKGAALVAGGYCTAAARPMSDFDLLVGASQAVPVALVLEAAGWRPDAPVDAASIGFRHAMRFKQGRRSCDLHWWALWDSRDDAADERFRAGAEIASWHGVEVRILRPEHQLAQIVLHGTRTCNTLASHWVGDALAVLRTRGDEFDWDLFGREVEARGFSHPVSEALAYLVDAFHAPVPAAVIDPSRSKPPSRRRRRLHSPRPGRCPNERMAFLEALLDLALAARTPRRTRLLWLLVNLQYAFGAPSLARLPAVVIRRGAHALARQRRGAKRTSTISSA